LAAIKNDTMRLAILFLFLAFESFGCICEYPTNDAEIDEMIKSADVIFLGTADGPRDTETSLLVQFDIVTSYKGNRNKNIKVSQQDNSCAQRFKKGQTYLIFGDTVNGGCHTSSCRVFIYHPDIELVRRIMARLPK